MNSAVNYKAAYERQKKARAKAEDILETKSRELYDKNQSLVEAYNNLKAHKAQLVHKEKLASIGQLSAGVAHEINNPLAFVKSNLNSLGRYTANFKLMLECYEQAFAQLSEQQLPPGLNSHIEQMRSELDMAHLLEDLDDLMSESLSGITRIEDIVKGLKSFARPPSDQSEPFNINDCIKNTIKLVWNEIKYKAKLDVSLSEVPDTVGYPGEISQVVLNLLVNATHAIDDTGTITVTTSCNDNLIELRVSDNGCGISEHHLSKIFDPFFTTKDSDSGTGLGLSIAHAIIKKHRGNIDVTTQTDQGTTFTICLPILDRPLQHQ
ncbi:sensor histidine kinase [Ferrimonas lipolytica]|uniref:histidine kinase n=1 Tax=Ferrimonas lipolytica TaxID=2724191 RepID=A0A6H1UB97_9GAMM|nr:ATP-binding protein [Ferrimonas lipolytica]QIZ76357.1 GHKL domain-containing protein [Ferrimonas lipolytica]